jgi:hypothetical protein
MGTPHYYGMRSAALELAATFLPAIVRMSLGFGQSSSMSRQEPKNRLSRQHRTIQP